MQITTDGHGGQGYFHLACPGTRFPRIVRARGDPAKKETGLWSNCSRDREEVFRVVLKPTVAFATNGALEREPQAERHNARRRPDNALRFAKAAAIYVGD
jgi:hypothetical protein